jgi:hypothetical protein
MDTTKTAAFGSWFIGQLNLPVGIRILNRLSQEWLWLWTLHGFIPNDFNFPRLLGFS